MLNFPVCYLISIATSGKRNSKLGKQLCACVRMKGAKRKMLGMKRCGVDGSVLLMSEIRSKFLLSRNNKPKYLSNCNSGATRCEGQESIAANPTNLSKKVFSIDRKDVLAF